MRLLTPQEREALLLTSLQKILDGELTEGKVLRQLRKDILGMSQDQYAALVGISRRTLSDIENDIGSQSIAVINSVFKPFGLRLGLLPSSKFLFEKLVEAQDSEDVLFSGQDRLSSFKREVHKASGWYELRRNDKGQFYFVLKAGIGEVILRSEIYESKAAAETGIAAVQKNSPLDECYDRKEAVNGKWYFNLRTANGMIIGTSQMYTSSTVRDNGIESVKANGATTTIAIK